MRLVKILIVMLFVLGMIYLSLTYFFQKYQSNIYNNLVSDLNYLSDLSINRQDPIDNSCQKVMGYMFESKQGDNYKLVEWCNNGYFIFKNVSLNKNIISINPSFPTTTFKVSGTTNLANDNDIELKRKLLGKDYKVTIAVVGYVK